MYNRYIINQLFYYYVLIKLFKHFNNIIHCLSQLRYIIK